MRPPIALALLELVTRECPPVAGAYVAGTSPEDGLRRARLAAGVIGAVELGGARPTDPRVEQETTRLPRRRSSSTPALAAAMTAVQHAEAARTHLDHTIDAIGETARFTAGHAWEPTR